MAWCIAVLAGSACQSISNLDDLIVNSTTVPADAAVDAAPPVQAAMPPAPRDAGTRDAEPKPDGSRESDASREPDASRPDLDSGTRCLIADGTDCNLAKQCGCDPGQHCQALSDKLRPTCVEIAPNAVAPWSACETSKQCPRGQACDRHSCRPYCADDTGCEHGKCLPARGPKGEPVENIKVCWKACEAGETCAAGTRCRSVKTPYGETASYCVAPEDPCTTEEDGQCDEPEIGNGTCAKGTDNKDCCPKPEGAACDMFAQCGCPRGSTCFEGKCQPPSDGTAERGEPCQKIDECRPGLVCVVGTLNVCSSFCRNNADCPDQGDCLLGPNASWGHCLDRCDRDPPRTCATGLRCIDFRPLEPGSFCSKPLADCTVSRRNGTCEERSGWCAAGTDPEDCCEPPIEGGRCDPVAQCGCSEQGQHCELVGGATGLTTSCQAIGKLQEGDYCNNIAQCAEGISCFSYVCRRFCDSGAHPCAAGQQCLPIGPVGVPEDEVKFSVKICVSSCDYTLNNCGPNQQCMRLGAVDVCAVPAQECPIALQQNGECDDTRPMASRQCAMGTDPECNVPRMQ